MEVEAKQLSQWLTDGGAILIDVREQKEYDAEYIRAAKLVPIGNLDHHDFSKYSDKKIVFHCGGGGRGGRATAKVKEEYPELECYNLKGGLRSWKSAGFDTIKSGEETKSFCEIKK